MMAAIKIKSTELEVMLRPFIYKTVLFVTQSSVIVTDIAFFIYFFCYAQCITFWNETLQF